jgi:UDP-glucose 4-epimerase
MVVFQEKRYYCDMKKSFKGKNVLITGASGFIGAHIVKKILDGDGVVYALMHNRYLPRRIKNDCLFEIKEDLSSKDKMRTIMEKADIVVHCAAYIPNNFNDSSTAAKCIEDNGILTLKLADVAAELKKRFIYISSGVVYRYSDKPVSENAVICPHGRAFYYALSKLVGEFFAQHLTANCGLRATILRVGSCYGPGMSKFSVVGRFMNSALCGERLDIIDGGTAKYDFVYIDDVVDAVVKVAVKPVHGVYNIATGKVASVFDLAKIITKIFPEKKIRIKINKSKNTAVKGFSPLSIAKAKKILSWQPRGLQQGLLDYKKFLTSGVDNG